MISLDAKLYFNHSEQTTRENITVIYLTNQIGHLGLRVFLSYLKLTSSV